MLRYDSAFFYERHTARDVPFLRHLPTTPQSAAHRKAAKPKAMI